MEGILDNPILQKFLAKQFKKYMIANKEVHGIYVSIGENDLIEFKEFKTKPETEINNLKKIIYGQTGGK